jgi:hypothetical protein
VYNLFTNYPIITYNNTLAVNILARVKFNDVAKNLGAVFYPYTISEGERPDSIAANYYDDPRYSWVVYMCNDIVDPYYDWYLTEKEFKEFIVKKYGSIERANIEIAYWEDNWYIDETTLTTAAYDALPPGRKKYFKPVTGVSGAVVNYERGQLGIAAETNKTIEITVANSASFSIGNYITQNTSGAMTGSGFIRGISDNTIVAQNILGEFANTAGAVGSLLNNDTGATSSVSNVVTINTSIPLDEQVFWTYLTKYEYEANLNESRKFIRLLDKSFIDQVEKELSEML